MVKFNLNKTYNFTHIIGAAIVCGDYSLGGAFPTEAELVLEFNVSRSVVRQAIKMLAAKGLLISTPRRGINVTPIEHWSIFDDDVLVWILNSKPSLKLLKEFAELRLAIEPEAAHLAAKNHHDKLKMEAIEIALLRLEQVIPLVNVTDLLAADIELHMAILNATKNSYFVKMGHFLRVAMQADFNISQITSSVSFSLGFYKKVFYAISTGDGLAAAKSMREYLEQLRSTYIESSRCLS